MKTTRFKKNMKISILMKMNQNKRSQIPIFSFIFLITLIIFLFVYIKEINSNILPNSNSSELSSKCLTTHENSQECKTCSPGDKLQDGKCLVNYSFKAVYHTESPNEKVSFFSFPKNIINEMIINETKIEPTTSYTFTVVGDHTIYALIDMNKCFTLGGAFNGIKQLTSIEFTPLFNTERVNEMNFMFQNCESLTSIDVSNLNTKNVINMEYMFSGCSSLKSLNLLNFNVENVEKMNSVFQGCSSLESIDLHTWNTKSMKNIEYLFARCSSLTSINLKGFNIYRKS